MVECTDNRRQGYGPPPSGCRACAVILVAVLALSACATDHFDPRPLSVQAIAEDFGARSLTSTELQGFIGRHQGRSDASWPPAVWNLEMLTLAAFHFNPELTAARARLATAEAGVSTAGQRPNPTLQLPLQGTLNPLNGISPWTLGLVLDIPLETAGRREYRSLAASQLASAARFRLAEAAWTIRSRLRSALLDMWFADARAELLGQRFALDQTLASQMERRRFAGQVSAWEAGQQQLAVLQSEAEHLAALNQVSAARAGLAAALGVGQGALDGVELDLSLFAASPPTLPDTLLGDALLNRADVGAALARYEASQAALQLELARQYPNINLGPGYIFDQGARRPGFSFGGLELPLFNRNEGPIAEARGRRREAEAQVKLVEVRALGDTEAAAAAFRNAQASLTQSEVRLAAQTRQSERLRQALAVGQEDRLAMVQAERSQLAARGAVLDSRFRLQQAVGSLEDALQRPLPAADENHKGK